MGLQTAKTNNLFCTKCKRKIKKGDQVFIEYSDYGVVIDVRCAGCCDHNTNVEDDHIFSSDAIDQW